MPRYRLRLSKALPPHLVPKIILKRTGGSQKYWVDPNANLPKPINEGKPRVDVGSATPVTRQQAREHLTRQVSEGPSTLLTDLAKIQAWAVHAVAENLEPQDVASVRLLVTAERQAGGAFHAEDWQDPVGEGPRKLREITDAPTLRDIQASLDGSATHDGRRVMLERAFEMSYPHKGFEEKVEEVGNVKPLYHGVNAQRAAAVLATGLKTPKDVGSVTGQMFGPGIYFTDSSTKAAQYIEHQFSRGRRGGMMLECEVALGTPFRATQGITPQEIKRGLSATPRARSDIGEDYIQAFDDTDWNDLADVLYFINHYTDDMGSDQNRLIYENVDDGASLDTVLALAKEREREAEGPERIATMAFVAWLEEDPNTAYGLNYDFAVGGRPLTLEVSERIDWPEYTAYLKDFLNGYVGTDEEREDVLSAADDLPYGLGSSIETAIEGMLEDRWRENEQLQNATKAEYAPQDTQEGLDWNSIKGLTLEEGGSLQHPEYIVYNADQAHIKRALQVRTETM